MADTTPFSVLNNPLTVVEITSVIPLKAKVKLMLLKARGYLNSSIEVVFQQAGCSESWNGGIER